MLKTILKQLIIFSLIFSITNLSAKTRVVEKNISKNSGFEFLWKDNNKKPKSSHWTNYKQTYGSENIRMKFPAVPTIVNDEYVNYVYCTKKKNIYTLTTSNPPKKIFANDAFSLAIATLNQTPNTLLGYKISTLNDNDLLELTSQHALTKVITKARLIITPYNFYLLRTIYPAGEKEEHEPFINSFLIN